MRNHTTVPVMGLLALLQVCASISFAAETVSLLGIGDGPSPAGTAGDSAPSATAMGSGPSAAVHPLTGRRVKLPQDWVGTRSLSPTVPILVMAGHADAQNIEKASGTTGFLGKTDPMDPTMTDELYWNLMVAREVVRQGRQRGLTIAFYDPSERTILWENDPRTTWSMGRAHVLAGGYAIEIHFDAYGKEGYGSGLIPPIQVDLRQPPAEGEEVPEPAEGDIEPMPPTTIDECLAQEFGRFTARFRDGLGASNRGISMLEVGQLEGNLEVALRSRPTQTVRAIATRIVDAMVRGSGAR